MQREKKRGGGSPPIERGGGLERAKRGNGDGKKQREGGRGRERESSQILTCFQPYEVTSGQECER